MKDEKKIKINLELNRSKSYYDTKKKELINLLERDFDINSNDQKGELANITKNALEYTIMSIFSKDYNEKELVKLNLMIIKMLKLANKGDYSRQNMIYSFWEFKNYIRGIIEK